MRGPLSVGVAALISLGCGARSPLDEPSPAVQVDASTLPIDASTDAHRLTVPDAPTLGPASCSFDLAGAETASITGDVAVAQTAAVEIDFIDFECQGAFGSTVYSLAGQYAPGQDSVQTWLSTSPSDPLENPATCAAEVTFNGAPARAGTLYAAGDAFTVSLVCPDSSDTHVASAHLSATLSAR